MIGIYKITNKTNNKSYIGQSVDIFRRWKEHKSLTKSGTQILYEAFRKYGINNFTFEILEECSPQELDNKEIYWSNYYNTLVPNGYNMVQCGNSSYGEYNQNSKYTTEEIYNIRKRIYVDNEEPISVQQDTGIERSYFYLITSGKYRTEPNSGVELIKSLKSFRASGENNIKATLTNEEVLNIRNRVHINNENQLQVFQDFKNKISFDAFRKVVKGETWTNIDCSMIKDLQVERKGKPKAKLTKQDVGYIRYRYKVLKESVSDIYKDYDNIVNRNTIKRVVNYETWKDVKPVSTIPEA